MTYPYLYIKTDSGFRRTGFKVDFLYNKVLNPIYKKIIKMVDIDIKQKGNHPYIVNARVAFIKLAYDTVKDYSVIARFLNKTHATIIFHQKKELKYFPEIAEIIKKYHEK